MMRRHSRSIVLRSILIHVLVIAFTEIGRILFTVA